MSAFLTVKEAAALLQLPCSTVYERIKAGQIPGVVHIGKHLRVNREVLLAWGTGESRVSRSGGNRER